MKNLRVWVHVVAVLFALTTGLGAMAQTTAADAVDYARWDSFATGADQALTEGKGSDAAFQTRRAELVTWRERFLTEQSRNADRIAILREQIASLGVVPEGITEDPEITARRADLNAQLGALVVPRLNASEAYTRADGLIKQIDRLLTARQTSALALRTGSPLDPRMWGDVGEDVFGGIATMFGEMRVAIASPAQRDLAQSRLGVIALLTILGVLFIFRARDVSERLRQAMDGLLTRGAVAPYALVASTLQYGLILLGLYVLVQAFDQTEFYGARAKLLIDSFWHIGLIAVGGAWLARQFFPKENLAPDLLPFDTHNIPAARRTLKIIAIVIACYYALAPLSAVSAFSAETLVVVDFAFTAMLAVLVTLLALGVRRVAHADQRPLTHMKASTVQKIVHYITFAACAASGVSLLASVLGYVTAGQTLMFATVASFALLGLLLVIFRGVDATFDLFTSDTGENGYEGLLPIVINTAVMLASLPFFALIWGARQTDLTEIWTKFKAGVTLGETTISPSLFMALVVVFLLGYFVTRAIQRVLRSTILPKTKMDVGGQTALVSGFGYIGIILSALIAISTAGLNLSSLAIVAGALSVGIGFGLQNIVSNFVSGVILLIERPISQGDWIEVGGAMGIVKDISVRSTRIETFDRTDLIVPNADLVSGTVTNFTRGNTVGRIVVPVGVAYGNDTRKVEALLREIAEAHPMVVLNPPPSVVFKGFGADSLDFEIRAILRDINWGVGTKTEINHQIAERFAEAGIEIPFAQRDIWIRNPEALSADK